MALPVAIEAEFGAGTFTWGGTASYVDLTARTFSFSIQRGRSDYSQPFQAGTCTIAMRNADGVLDPDNATGPYFGKIEPGRRVRITSNSTSGTLSRVLFVGFITDIRLSYELGGDAAVTITAADGLSLLAQQSLPSGTSFAEESTSDRFLSVLGSPGVDYPFPVGSASGISICAAGSGEGNVLSYLASVAQTEQGAVFVDREGALEFKNRYEVLSAPVEAFSDDTTSGDTNYESIDRLVTALELFNRLAANRPGENNVVRDSSTSAGSFGVRFLDLGVVLFRTDAEIVDMLDFAMVRFASTSPRIAQVTTLLDAKTSTTIKDLVQLDLTDSVTVEFTPPGVAQIAVACSIESIRHDYTVGSGWRLTFGFTPRDTSAYLTLDDDDLGRLDFNALVF
jgi:hypothetical protein